MQTTLRINDTLYREAKARAARAGISLTRFIEDALRTKLADGGSDGFMVREAQPAYGATPLTGPDEMALTALLREFQEEEKGAGEAWREELLARKQLARSGKAKGTPLKTFLEELERRLGS